MVMSRGSAWAGVRAPTDGVFRQQQGLVVHPGRGTARARVGRARAATGDLGMGLPSIAVEQAGGGWQSGGHWRRVSMLPLLKFSKSRLSPMIQRALLRRLLRARGWRRRRRPCCSGGVVVAVVRAGKAGGFFVSAMDAGGFHRVSGASAGSGEAREHAGARRRADASRRAGKKRENSRDAARTAPKRPPIHRPGHTITWPLLTPSASALIDLRATARQAWTLGAGHRQLRRA